MAELITNTGKRKNHLSLLKMLGKKADAIFIAVAFFRQSGYALLEPILKEALRRKTPVKAICGLNFGLSEPEALRRLARLLNKATGSGAFFPKDENATFHPKLYCFKIEEELHVVAGSANVTEGGLTGNAEVSLYWHTPLKAPEAREIMEYLDFLFSKDFAVPATLLRISQYKAFHREQEQYRRKYSKQRQPKPKKKLKVDYTILQEFYEDFLNEEDVEEYDEDRKQGYLQARDVLEQITSNGISKAEFIPLYEKLVGAQGQGRLWHPDSLYRKKADVFRHYKKFIKVVKFVKENLDEPVPRVFDRGKELIAEVPGVGPNILTEIMLTYRPDKFASLNRNPITVLTEAHCGLKQSPATYKGEDYEEFCELFEEIRQKLHLPTNLEVDSFLNHAYWKLKHKA